MQDNSSLAAAPLTKQKTDEIVDWRRFDGAYDAPVKVVPNDLYARDIAGRTVAVITTHYERDGILDYYALHMPDPIEPGEWHGVDTFLDLDRAKAFAAREIARPQLEAA